MSTREQIGGKPLIRRFWVPTSVTDANPHLVFRPREKERYKLRRHRKNDLEAFRKMQQLRRDFETVRALTLATLHRERLKQAQLELQSEMQRFSLLAD